MVRRGRHAADDGSFGRSAGTAMGRGILLLAAALLIGIALLQRVDDPVGEQQVSAQSDNTTTTTMPAVVEPTTTTAPARDPKSVRVLTANGTSVRGAGGRIKDRVLAGGYNALAATDTKAPAAASVVYFTAGFEREAAALATLLGLQSSAVQPIPAPPPVADLKAANLLVVVGPDLAQAASTTTTARAGATTTTTARSATSSTTSTTR